MLHNLGMLSFVQLLAKEYKRKNPHFDDEEFYKEIGIDCNTLSPVDKKNWLGSLFYSINGYIVLRYIFIGDDNMTKEYYTLDQLRKMNQIDGDKQLIFVHQHEKIVKKLKEEIKHYEMALWWWL